MSFDNNKDNRDFVFRDLTNQFAVDKTLRFKLIPVGKTQDWINKRGVIDTDEAIYDDSQRVKEIIDDYHRWFIDDVLECINIDKWEELFGCISKFKSSNSISERKDLDSFQEQIRYDVVSSFASRNEYKALTERLDALIKDVLPAWMKERNEYSDNDFKIVNSFRGFTGYLINYNTARKNMYSKEAHGTAIANRAVNENFTRFASNIITLKNIIKEFPNIEVSILDNDVNLMSPESYNSFLSSNGIQVYNEAIGRINSILNEAYQQGELTKRCRLSILYKQILCEGESKFTLNFKIDSVKCLFSSIDEVFEELVSAEGIDVFSEFIRLCENLHYCNLDAVFVNCKLLRFLSNAVFGNSSVIVNSLRECALTQDGPLKGATKDKILQWVDNKATKYSIDDILSALQHSNFADMDIMDISSFENALSCNLKGLLEVIHDQSKTYEILKTKYLDIGTDCENLIPDEKDISIVKSLFDSIKEFESYFRLFSCDDNLDKDPIFYSRFDELHGAYLHFDRLYDLVRNYLTQKPYNTEKIKLNFGESHLCDGWDINKEMSNLCTILRKDGLYYLGIINKDDKVNLNDFTANETNETFEKMIYKVIPGANKQIPKVLFRTTNPPVLATDEILTIKNSKTFNQGTNFSREDLLTYLKFLINALTKDEWVNIEGAVGENEWNKYFKFSFGDPESYTSYKDFLDDVDRQGYSLDFINISEEKVNMLVDEGKLYLFQIYNKDYSKFSSGNKNLHTLYWEYLFSDQNKELHFPFRLNGQGRLFFRKKSVSDPIEHRKGDVLVNKTFIKDGCRHTIPDDVYGIISDFLNGKHKFDHEMSVSEKKAKELLDEKLVKSKSTPHTIIKDKRFTNDHFEFHVPITINSLSSGARNFELNSKILNRLYTSDNIAVLGIDRGERHLLYLTLVDRRGSIILQKTLNAVGNDNGIANYEFDYHEKLDLIEKERDVARKSWRNITKISDLKQGYLSQVIYEIEKIVLKYNCIVVMEDLNFGFKRGRFKVEKQVYQKFENQLIDKLSYMCEKPPRICTDSNGGVGHGYQLAIKPNSVKKVGKQNGIVFYVPAWNTSHVDPTTGFINLFRYSDKAEYWRSLFGDMRRIAYNKQNDYFEFEFSYQDFEGKSLISCVDSGRTWIVCTSGDYRLFNDKDNNGKWCTKEINVNHEMKVFLEKAGIDFIDGGDLRHDICCLKGIKHFGWLFKCLMDLRYSRIGTEEDFILSPVINSSGFFFDSRNECQELPKDADANGAYHIALKGVKLIDEIEKDSNGNFKLANSKGRKTNQEWAKWLQTFHEDEL